MTIEEIKEVLRIAMPLIEEAYEDDRKYPGPHQGDHSYTSPWLLELREIPAALEKIQKEFIEADEEAGQIVKDLCNKHEYNSMHFADARAVRLSYIRLERKLK